MRDVSAFKAYDIRGRVGDNIDAGLARDIGRAFAQVMTPDTVVLGRDIRESGPELLDAVAAGLREGGVDVIDIGLCGTEEVYFATDHLGAGGGMMITASHNPIGDNGIKPIGPGARPLTEDTGLGAIRDLVASGDFRAPAARPGGMRRVDVRAAYVARVLGFVDGPALRPLKILVNAGNGTAGPTFDAVASGLVAAGAHIAFTRMHHTPRADFPNGVPNPLLVENRPDTARAVREAGADFGVAWDGDFDRCFLFDETGTFIDGEYVVGLLAAAMLARHPGARVVHDPRIIWNTQRLVAEVGGQAVISRTGHALMKEKMREVDAVYGGEMSAHHYFRDFMYCDSGMIPWLLVAAHLSAEKAPLSALIADMKAHHPSSGEINFRLSDPGAAVAAVEAEFAGGGTVDRLDGLSVAFDDWRFNLRMSNTEPLVRLNVETRGDRGALVGHVTALSRVLKQHE